MFNKILIANRGEIAVRIMRTCRALGIATVAVYSEADAGGYHVREADEAVLIGPPAPSESYLRAERIIEAALDRGAEAVHPGFGFLAENANFARAVRAAGIQFIGPSAEAIERMGSKTAARSLMEAAGVPVVPGYQGETSSRTMADAAAQIGYPVMVKAAAGGGGKGMRIVHEASELADAIGAAQREARNAFGDDRVFLEKFVTQPRHIEFQIFGDAHGNIVHLFERDCSIQRRHQKIVEESPSPFMSESLRVAMGDAAVNAARAVDYVGAGTVEFIVDAERNFYFLEMNTRLQVEHPVTELVTGQDLVAWQIAVAAGQPLPVQQQELQQQGHALECRVYAEDAAKNFLPDTGVVQLADEPEGIRVDAGVQGGDAVTIHYDPMISKVIVHGASRGEALRRMRWALDHYTLLGLTTNIDYLKALICHPAFIAGDITTDFIAQHMSDWQPADIDITDYALIALAVADRADRAKNERRERLSSRDPHNPWQISDGFRLSIRGESSEQPT